MRVHRSSACFLRPAFVLALGAAAGAQTLLDLHGVRGDRLGCAVRAAGDFDQDGEPDVLIAADQLGTAETRPAYTAGSVGILSGRDGSLLFHVTGLEYLARTGRTEVEYFGVEVAAVGDLDLDGTGDVLVAHGSSKQLRRVVGYSGASGALLFELDDPYGGHTSYGSSLVALGDVLDTTGGPNPDGVPDFAVGAAVNPVSTVPATYPGRVYLYSGAAPTGGPVITLRGAFPRIAFGHDLAVVGDLDGDGLPGLAVSASLGSYVEVYDGPGFASMVVLNSPFPFPVLYGFSIAHLGDLNGDGWSELAVGAPAARQAEGSVLVYSLDPANPVELLRVEHANPVPGMEFGLTIAGLPLDPRTGLGLLDLDHDGSPDPFLDWSRDGVPDFVIGAAGFDLPLQNVENAGGIFLVRGTGATRERGDHALRQGPGSPSDYAYLPGLVPEVDEGFGQRLALLGNSAGESQVRFAAGTPRDGVMRGSAVVLRLPFAHFDDDTFSRANDGVGSSRTLELDFGPRYAGRRFVLLGTTAGGNPGQVFQGRTIPLNDDGPGGLFARTTSLQTSGFPLGFSQLTGFLDGAGQAQVTLTVTAPTAGHPWFAVPEQLYLPIIMQRNRHFRIGLVGAPTVLRIE